MGGPARHPALASHRHDGDACDGGDGGTGVCDDCGGRRPAAAFGAAPHPARSRCTAFLASLRTGAYRDAAGMVKAALLGGAVKVVGDLLRAVHVEGAPRLPDGRGEVAALGRDPFPRPRGWTPSTPIWPVANRSSCPCGRSRGFAREVTDDLCAAYHDRLTRHQGEGEAAGDSWR
ncbi:hypothetical protein AB0O22_31045 [Streptomyces sp. NPDC091204]|uniref:hypothetical protein n=1 Tax=Streptomyces sp. NPDC091204 TaxID=3155299 RepID=UPI003423CF14